MGFSDEWEKEGRKFRKNCDTIQNVESRQETALFFCLFLWCSSPSFLPKTVAARFSLSDQRVYNRLSASHRRAGELRLLAVQLRWEAHRKRTAVELMRSPPAHGAVLRKRKRKRGEKGVPKKAGRGLASTGGKLIQEEDMIKKELIRIKVEDLIPYGRNPRKIPQEAIDDVRESIRQCGPLDPIEIDENNVILAGHTRRMAYMAEGVKEVDALRYTGLTEKQKKKYRLPANKTGEKSGWDYELRRQSYFLTEHLQSRTCTDFGE